MPQCTICNIKIHVEVPLFLYFFGYMLSASVRTNFVIYKTCYVTLGYNQSECALLGGKHPDKHTADLEQAVQPYAAVLGMVLSVVEALVSAVICVFVGPWSDRFGRTPILITTLIGYTGFYMSLSLFSIFENVSPWFMLLCIIPTLVTGGGSCFLTAILAYITDVTDERNRGTRMGSFEALLSFGIFVGNISSSYIFVATSYTVVFFLSGLCCLLALLFSIFFIPESLPNPESEGRYRGFFRASNVLDLVRTTFKARPSFERYTVLCCVLMLTVYIIDIDGGSSVTFLYLREKFHWSLETFTLYSAAHNVAWVLGTIIGVHGIHKLLDIPETIMILIGFISMMNGVLVMGLSRKNYGVYFGAFVRSLGGVLSPMMRSLVSKIVPNEEVGKIFALIIISESLFGMMGAPVYTAIYNSSILTNPAVVYFFSTGVYMFLVLVITSVIIVRTVWKREETYSQLVNENVEQEPVEVNA